MAEPTQIKEVVMTLGEIRFEIINRLSLPVTEEQILDALGLAEKPGRDEALRVNLDDLEHRLRVVLGCEPKEKQYTFQGHFQELDRRKLVAGLVKAGIDEDTADEWVLYIFAGEPKPQVGPMTVLKQVVESDHQDVGSKRPVSWDLATAEDDDRYLKVPSYFTWDPWPAAIRKDSDVSHSLTSHEVRLFTEGLLKARKDYDPRHCPDEELRRIRDAAILGDLAIDKIDLRRPPKQHTNPSIPAPDSSDASTNQSTQKEGNNMDEIQERIERLVKFLIKAPPTDIFLADGDVVIELCVAMEGNDENEATIREFAQTALDNNAQEA